MLGKGHGGLHNAPTKEESKRPREERDQIKFEKWQAVTCRKAREGKRFHKLHVLGTNDDLWDKASGLGSETWRGCE